MKNELLQQLGINIELLLAGFFGALLLVRKEKKSIKENAMTLITGAFSASYIASFIADTFGISSQNALTFVGFVVGFGSIQILEFIMDKYFKKKDNDSTT